MQKKPNTLIAHSEKLPTKASYCQGHLLKANQIIFHCDSSMDTLDFFSWSRAALKIGNEGPSLHAFVF